MLISTLLAVALAAPVPKAKPSDLYFPTVEGTKLVTTFKKGDQTSETTTTVTKVVEKDGRFTVTVSHDHSGSIEFKYEVSAKGVFTLTNLFGELSVPIPEFKIPAKEGDTWTSELPALGSGATWPVTHTVGQEEEVEVPAGKFKAIVVVTEVTSNGRVFWDRSWHAAGVGVVKSENSLNHTSELKEFTVPKAK